MLQVVERAKTDSGNRAAKGKATEEEKVLELSMLRMCKIYQEEAFLVSQSAFA